MSVSKTLLSLLFLTVSFTHSYGQGQTLDQVIPGISAQIKQVKTADGQIDQKLKVIRENIVSLEITKTDNKGKSSVQTYQLNLADINEHNVKDLLDGQVMYVEVPIKEGNKYIECTKDGKAEGYQSSLRICAYDVDNARALVKAIQSSISVAEATELHKYSFSSQNEIFAALFRAISENTSNEQKAKSTADKKEKLDYSSVKDGKTAMFEFNLVDINPTKIVIKTSGFLGIIPGKSLSVSVETNNNEKVVKQFENDVPKSYVSAFSITPFDIENAKKIKNLLYLTIQNIKSGATSLTDFSYAGSMAATGSDVAASTTQTDRTSSPAAKASGGAPASSSIDKNTPDPVYTSKPATVQPEFDNTPVWYDVSGILKNLERPIVNKGSRSTGLTSGESYLAIGGTTSSVRFKSGNLPKMYIKVAPGVDPATIVEFASFNVNKSKDQREYIIHKTGMGHTESTQSVMGIDFRRVDNSVYEIVFAGDLGKGEYSFGNEAAHRVYCFTVYEGKDDAKTQGDDLKDGKKK